MVVVRNLVAAKDIPGEKFAGRSRILNLPGRTVTVEEMLEGLRKVGGQKAVDLVQERYDEKVAGIVGSWPAVFDTERAEELGFWGDGTLERTSAGGVENARRETIHMIQGRRFDESSLVTVKSTGVSMNLRSLLNRTHDVSAD